jgi:polysaccharide biosynthesis/export protein
MKRGQMPTTSREIGAALIICCGVVGHASASDWLSSSGPSVKQITVPDKKYSPIIRVVEINGPAVNRIVAAQHEQLFSATLGDGKAVDYSVGPGDLVEVSIWEAPPAMLFDVPSTSSSASSGDEEIGLPRLTTVPAQMVEQDGSVSIPFVGTLKVAGQTPRQIESAVAHALAGKANQPQVLVNVIRNVSSNVAVVGEVAKSLQMPLTAKGERVLDAIASAGGLREGVPIQKATVRVTRGSAVLSMPLESVLKDPAENVRLAPGDVVTTLFQPLSLTVLGAVTKSQELMFEAQGISLSQALARSSGLADTLADAQGVFVFRFEQPAAVEGKLPPSELVTEDGRVPLVYRLDLKNPASFLVAKDFPMRDGDVIYVATAPAAQLQKFLNILTSSVFSAANLVHLGGNN